MKKANGQIIACNEIFEEDVTSIKNYGVWIRYQSRTGFHNAYKEYREVSMNKAVDALYEEMACLLYTSASPRDLSTYRMPSSA